MNSLQEKLHEIKVWHVAIPVAVVVCIAGGVVAFVRSLPTPHLTIEVVNDTGAPMADVHFLYSDGKALCTSKRIPTGGKVAWDVTGMSHGFSLNYRGAKDQVVTRKCDLPFDGDDWGTMSLHIKHDSFKVLTEVDPAGKASNH